jgi:hypothetical protein
MIWRFGIIGAHPILLQTTMMDLGLAIGSLVSGNILTLTSILRPAERL